MFILVSFREHIKENFYIYLYHFISIYYFCNSNTLLKRTHLGMAKKMKGGEGLGIGGERRKRSQGLDDKVLTG